MRNLIDETLSLASMPKKASVSGIAVLKKFYTKPYT